MKIAAAQLKPHVGEVERNLDAHLQLIESGKRHDADLIVFPELSLSGYEPTLAADHARPPNDSCFDVLQAACDKNSVSVVVGFSLRTEGLPSIAAMRLSPTQQRRVFRKRYLHQDEIPFFSVGDGPFEYLNDEPYVALAICYELSCEEHAKESFSGDCHVYVASAAKDLAGVESASQRLAELAKTHSAITLFANCFGEFDGVQCAGQSAAWGRNGQLLARLNADSTGLILVDSTTGQVDLERLNNVDSV